MSRPYIRLYNVFTEDSDYRLSSRQLYFYALLDAMKSVFMGYTQTTLSIVCQNQIVFIDKNESRRIDECRNVILSLANKNVIELESEPNVKANTPLKIRFPVFKGGYEDIHIDIWEKVSSPDELMVFTMLKRMSGFEKSKDQWSRVLGYSSKNTGNEIVKKMESDAKIYSVEGNIYTDAQGRTKQHPTKWYIGKRPEKKETFIDDSFSLNEILSEEDELGIQWGHWKKGDLTLDDYIIYVQQEDNQEFMKVAKSKINRITSNGTNEKATYKSEQQIEKAREELQIIKKRQEIESNDKNKESILERYSVCIELKDGSFTSHKDMFDWSKMKNFHYLNDKKEKASTSVKGAYPIYEALLPQYDEIDYKTLMDDISPYIMGEKKIDGVEAVEFEEDKYDYRYEYR